MKKILFLSISMMAMMAKAQPVIQSSAYYPAGTSLLFQIADISSVQPGPAGAAQNWNFSSLTLTGDQYQHAHIPAASSPFSGVFPASNRAVRITSPTSSDTNYIYQTVSGTGAYYDGSALHASGSDIVFQYTNPQTIFKYPVTYNWSDADFFSSSMVTSGGGITFTNYRYGPQQAVADGYGTLQLPGATYTNCLRIKYRQVITDSLVMTGIPLPADIQTTIKTMYTWIQLVNGVAVERMTMTYDTISDGSSTTYKTYCQLNNSTTTGLTPASATRQMNVYPNPTTHSIFLPEVENSLSDYRTDILDLQGKIVFSLTNEESPTQKPVAIPVQQLSPGTYIVRLSRPDISHYAKFIKQ